MGNGRFFYLNDRTVEIECNFPSNNRLISNIVWVRKAFHSRDYYPRVREFTNYNYDFGSGDRRRYEVKSLGPNTSTLIIRDYQSHLDDGIYRCFATRRNPYGSGTETVYIETEVQNQSQNGIYSGCGGRCNG